MENTEELVEDIIDELRGRKNTLMWDDIDEDIQLEIKQVLTNLIDRYDGR